jgi:hypothetical protein
MHLEISMLGGVETSAGLAQVQSQLGNLTMQLQYMAKTKVVHENVWFTMFHTKGHHKNEFPMLGNYTTTGASNPFPTGPKMEWCEIYRQWGHIPPRCPTLQKYQKTTHTPFCEFYKYMGHDAKNYWSLQLMQEHTIDVFRFQEKYKGGDHGGFDRGGYRGGQRGGYG